MSRHELLPLASTLEQLGDPSIVIGWDAPLETFFLIVKDRSIGEAEGDDPIRVWLGTTFREVERADRILAAARPWAFFIAPELIAQLEYDRSAD